MFPYRDENVSLRTPIATFCLIAANVAIWLLIQGAGSPLPLATSVCDLGLVAGELTGRLAPGTAFPMGDGLACVVDPGRQPLHLLTHMFLHGSWMHLLGNMWFLWIFGNNVEDSMGPVKYFFFYILGGIAALALQVAIHPDDTAPTLGASGAIAAVLGGYILLYPRARVLTLIFIILFFTVVELPAILVLGFWFATQIAFGAAGLTSPGASGGVAYFAHVGGFAFGVATVKLLATRRRRIPPPR